eukprot:CAMPEP_0116004504 /NCGR_PEP_ID=MMETSP0321-20121206/636_1 /TAXON_ID=163516 /ORGANISM="Leptocylindrus danicus var. danicus, Strain B650" /LENGTH=95 /DNA_ID=CAMNT_0003472807 /DNA_START=1021 /DNA_END=1308 /DNA_ORIENTATION=-
MTSLGPQGSFILQFVCSLSLPVQGFLNALVYTHFKAPSKIIGLCQNCFEWLFRRGRSSIRSFGTSTATQQITELEAQLSNFEERTEDPISVVHPV